MMSAITAAAERVQAGAVGRWSAKLGIFLDCAIPIALVTVILAAFVAIATGTIH